MQTQASPDIIRADKAPLLRRLARVFLPGRISARVEAAASLPLWMSGLIIVLAITFLSGAAGYNVAIVSLMKTVFLDAPGRGVGAAIGQMYQDLKANVLDMLFSNPLQMLIGLFVLGLILVGLEVLSLLLFAPFSVPMGQKLRNGLGKCRKVVWSLGGLWLVQTGIVWIGVTTFVAPWVYYAMTNPMKGSGYIATMFVPCIFCLALPLALLIDWSFRVMRACSQLAGPEGSPPAQRCGGCGYLLQGLTAGTGCPECGLQDPSGPDRDRQPTAWSRPRGTGLLAALLWTSAAVLVCPGKFFRGMQVLGQTQEGRQFVRWTLWLSIPLSVLSLPGVLAAWSSNRVGPDEWYTIGGITAVTSLVSALLILATLGVLIGLAGVTISRARQEPAWPIAAAAGGYLAGLVPWIAAGQALWLWPFFAIEHHDRLIWYTCMVWGQSLGISPVISYGVLLLMPAIAGFLLAVRTAVVCYRSVRYACR